MGSSGTPLKLSKAPFALPTSSSLSRRIVWPQNPVRQPVGPGHAPAGGQAGVANDGPLVVQKIHPVGFAMRVVAQKVVAWQVEKPSKASTRSSSSGPSYTLPARLMCTWPLALARSVGWLYSGDRPGSPCRPAQARHCPRSRFPDQAPGHARPVTKVGRACARRPHLLLQQRLLLRAIDSHPAPAPSS
jgi:hypothetical protein